MIRFGQAKGVAIDREWRSSKCRTELIPRHVQEPLWLASLLARSEKNQLDCTSSCDVRSRSQLGEQPRRICTCNPFETASG